MRFQSAPSPPNTLVPQYANIQRQRRGRRPLTGWAKNMALKGRIIYFCAGHFEYYRPLIIWAAAVVRILDSVAVLIGVIEKWSSGPEYLDAGVQHMKGRGAEFS